MILIKKGTPPSELEELKQKAEFLGQIGRAHV